jgi:hypothetical protein
VIDKSAEEMVRREHFTHTEDYLQYYDEVISDPVLWHEGSVRLQPDTDFVGLGLMRRGDWRA